MIGFDELHQAADALAKPVSICVAGGADPTVIAAMRIAIDRGWVAPILAGKEAAIRDVAGSLNLSLDGFTIADAEDNEVAAKAVAEVKSGRAAVLVKGRVATPDLMHAILNPEHGLRSGKAVCQVVLMEIPRDNRRFLLADTGVMVRPKLGKKIDLMQSCVAIARILGSEHPLLAMMSASEKVIDTLPDTFDAAELQRRNEHGEFPGVTIQGPLSFDLAYAPVAAGRKGMQGTVVGAADIMIFPDLSSANLTVKAIMYTADCRFGGILQGTTAPVAFMSRADDVPTRLNSLALALRLIAS